MRDLGKDVLQNNLLVVRDWSVAVTVINFCRPFAIEVQMEHILVSFVFPPSAKLPIPLTRQYVEQLLVFHAEQTKKVLVAQVALEVEFLR